MVKIPGNMGEDYSIGEVTALLREIYQHFRKYGAHARENRVWQIQATFLNERDGFYYTGD